jgi:hypothetical protein
MADDIMSLYGSAFGCWVEKVAPKISAELGSGMKKLRQKFLDPNTTMGPRVQWGGGGSPRLGPEGRAEPGGSCCAEETPGKGFAAEAVITFL